jgi:hypothetical protein
VKEKEEFDDMEKEFLYDAMVSDFLDFFERFSCYMYTDAIIPEVRTSPCSTSPLRSSTSPSITWAPVGGGRIFRFLLALIR